LHVVVVEKTIGIDTGGIITRFCIVYELGPVNAFKQTGSRAVESHLGVEVGNVHLNGGIGLGRGRRSRNVNVEGNVGLRELHLFIPEFALYDRDFFKGIINPVVFQFDDRIPGVIIPATEHGVGKLARIVYFGTVGQVRPGDQVILTVGQVQVNPLVSLQVADTFCPGHHEFPVAVRRTGLPGRFFPGTDIVPECRRNR